MPRKQNFRQFKGRLTRKRQPTSHEKLHYSRET